MKRLLLAAAVGLLCACSGGGGGDLEGHPMCDTNETGPGIVNIDGVNYDEECLKAYND